MIIVSSVVLTMCNSGARRVKCIRVYKKSGRSVGLLGDLLKVIVVRLRNRGHIRVKKSEMHLALVTRLITPLFRSTKGIFFKFDFGAVVLLNKKKTPIGTRIFGPVPRELRSKNYLKIVSLASSIL